MVVNASARGKWAAASPLMRIPLLGELLTLLREKSILYQVGTSTRRSALIEQFDTVRYLRSQPPSPERDAVLAELGPGGTLVHIATSPAWTAQPDRVAAQFRPACARVAVAGALDGFGEQEWVRGLADRSPKIKTTPAKIGRADSVGLLWHGYVLAMSNLHVFFDPLLDIPPKARFETLIA